MEFTPITETETKTITTGYTISLSPEEAKKLHHILVYNAFKNHSGEGLGTLGAFLNEAGFGGNNSALSQQTPPLV